MDYYLFYTVSSGAEIGDGVVLPAALFSFTAKVFENAFVRVMPVGTSFANEVMAMGWYSYAGCADKVHILAAMCKNGMRLREAKKRLAEADALQKEMAQYGIDQGWEIFHP